MDPKSSTDNLIVVLNKGVGMGFEKIIEEFIETRFRRKAEEKSYEIINFINQVASDVVEVRIDRPDTDSFHIFIKRLHGKLGEETYLKNQEIIENEYEMLKKVNYNLERYKEISVVKPLSVFPKHLALVTLASPGDCALDVIKRGILKLGKSANFNRAINLSKNSGKFLVALQEANLGSEVNLSSIDIAQAIVGNIKELRSLLTYNAYNKMLRTMNSFLLDDFFTCAHTVVGSIFHGDFHPGNIIADANAVVVLDFSDNGIGSVYHDIARFWQSLNNYKIDPRFSQKKIKKLQDVFLCPLAPIHSKLFTAYRLMTLFGAIKERLRLASLFQNKLSFAWVLNKYFLSQRINDVLRINY